MNNYNEAITKTLYLSLLKINGYQSTSSTQDEEDEDDVPIVPNPWCRTLVPLPWKEKAITYSDVVEISA